MGHRLELALNELTGEIDSCLSRHAYMLVYIRPNIVHRPPARQEPRLSTGVWSYSSPLVSPRDGGQWDRSDFERIRDAAMTTGNRS